ncbi:MAG: TRAP transporter substrate-binding protein DctP [Actinomycetota bacterium]|nr:TRAP transporter substrate-binding protein DctP [Actinomycetota bacterium]
MQVTANNSRRALVAALSASALVLAACGGGDSSSGSSESADTQTLRLSHQWPAPQGDEGDFRSLLAQRFSDAVNEKTGGSVQIDVFPNSTISESTEQYDAMTSGAIDLSVFPLDYASGQVPEFSITLMPTLPRSHAEAQQWQDAEIGKRIEEITEENGVKILTWVWNAGAIGSKGDPIVVPDDISSGMKMRAAGSYVEEMLKNAGAGISSLPSSEIYSAMQTGVLDAAVTSTGSFDSYNLQEQVSSYTSPTKDYTFWFMFEPLIISTSAWEKLSPEQQTALEEAGTELQDFAYEAAEEDDARVEQVFTDAGVEVVAMDEAAFSEWQTLAEDVWADFAQNVEGGDELLELAKEASN